MEEFSPKCLRIHGYCSSSDESSGLDETKDDFDDLYKLYKPPPILVDPNKHNIIEIKGTKALSRLLALNSSTNEEDFWESTPDLVHDDLYEHLPDDFEQIADPLLQNEELYQHLSDKVEKVALSKNVAGNDDQRAEFNGSGVKEISSQSNETKPTSRQSYRKRYRRKQALKKAQSKGKP